MLGGSWGVLKKETSEWCTLGPRRSLLQRDKSRLCRWPIFQFLFLSQGFAVGSRYQLVQGGGGRSLAGGGFNVGGRV